MRKRGAQRSQIDPHSVYLSLPSPLAVILSSCLFVICIFKSRSVRFSRLQTDCEKYCIFEIHFVT